MAVSALSEELSLLSGLIHIQQGQAAYYKQLRTSRDVFLAVGAFCMLLESKQLPFPMWEEVFSLCRFGAVRRRAYDFFRFVARDDLAQRAADTALESSADIDQALMQAELRFDQAGVAEAEGANYLRSADIAVLERASERAEVAGGWREALLWATRAAAIAPLSPLPLRRLFIVLDNANKPQLSAELANLYIGRNMHLQIAQIFLAQAALARKDPGLCLKKLAPLDDARIGDNPVLAPYRNIVRNMRAVAEEQLGHYRKAYETYVQVNAADRDSKVDPSHYYKGVEARGKLNVPVDLPAVDTTPVVQMLGFPRSGTTLLENVLNAHPQIETFEEIPALHVAIDRIERTIMGRSLPEEPRDTFMAARATYYHEIERRRRKADTTVLVDKMPIRSADAKFTTQLFPEWRYIFSVRHPYDVVLSCFKQRFKPNPAMENFRTIEGAVRLYDFTMTEWFKHFSLDDSRVSYVRYDQLVTDFEATTGRVLDFLGLPWVDDVTNFAEASEKRAAQTPSYKKVRQGLSLGVQTYWRNYDFIFQTPVAKPLHRWAEFFGYETT